MSARIFYKQNSEHARPVIEFLHDFEHQTGKKLETVDPDTREGAELCHLYDIVEYPTIIATGGDGQMKNQWRGLPLPTIDEVSYYV